ncbi:hypothetical protein FQA47_003774 [Oryzias melastigma]|uniref:Uncharacterized protein n=1 Tax=Oryzias melastigma TaxID=30732 RepID=A0A834BUE7_ORYME|nr:hypothetical protein FQA47_003774 [Oryzias melastigma]
MECQHLFTVKTEEHGLHGNRLADPCLLGSRMSDQYFLGLQTEDRLCSGSFQTASKSHPDAPKANKCHLRMKVEDCTVFGARMDSHLLPGAGMEDQLSVKATLQRGLYQVQRPATSSCPQPRWPPSFSLWLQRRAAILRSQDGGPMPPSRPVAGHVERAGKSSSQQVDRMTPPTRNSAALKVDVESFHPLKPLNSQESPPGKTLLSLLLLCGRTLMRFTG